MRLAAIDIGTNSTKMTIADISEDGALSVVSEDSQITRLGEGVDQSHRLSDAAITRTLNAMGRFAEVARSDGTEKIVAAGTSALRDAENGAEFLRQAQRQTGLDIEIITGDREAQLAFAAVCSDPLLRLPDTPLLVFDIGGGSTELILGEGKTIQRHDSLNVGAVRLTERFFPADPPTDEQLASASAFTDSLLATFSRPVQTPYVVGIGGTAVNLASVTRGLPKTNPNAVHAATLSATDVAHALHRFGAVPVAVRREIAGLEPARADVILGGTVVLSRLLAYFQTDRFIVSARGLRYGLLAETAKIPASHEMQG